MTTKFSHRLPLVFAFLLALSPGCSTGKKTSADALTELQGRWRIETALKGGSPMKMGFAYVDVHGNLMDRITTEKVFHRRIRVDVAANPPTMDLEILDEQDKGQVMLGIYRIEKNRLYICHAPVGKPRPTSFSSTEEDGNVLAVSKRPTPGAE